MIADDKSCLISSTISVIDHKLLVELNEKIMKNYK